MSAIIHNVINPYLDNMLTAVCKNARYTLNGERLACGKLTSSTLADILEQLPENTPPSAIDELIKLSNSPNVNVYSASEQIQESMQNRTRQGLLKRLRQLYQNVAVNAEKNGNLKRAEVFRSAASNVDNLDNSILYSNTLDALYKDLRCANYDLKFIKDLNISEFTGMGNNLIKVKKQNGWHYRMPNNRIATNVNDRISINAIADKNLIKELDNLLGSGNVKGYYKTPDISANWLERHDPITIYLDEQATPEVLNKIKAVCSKYIRSTEDVLSGNKFASGMALQTSPTQKDIANLIEEAEMYDIELSRVLKTNFTDMKTGNLKTSAGYMESAKKMLGLI